MPTPALLLLLTAVFPLASFLLLLFLGRKIGNPLSGYVACVALFASLGLSLLAMISWVRTGTYNGVDWGAAVGPVIWSIRWLSLGDLHLDLGIYVDSLTVAMVNMFTLTAVLVHVYSLGYMRKEPGYPRFFAYLGLASFAMIGLLLAVSLLQIFIFWQLLTIASFLFIGFRAADKTAGSSAIETGFFHLFGDIGLVLSLAALISRFGNSSLPQLWISLAATSSPWLTYIGFGLLLAALTKAAQFPFHVWFSHATHAPAPSIALFISLGQGGGAVYLLARVFPLLTAEVKFAALLAGCITILLAALVAAFQRDLQRLIAWCSIAQIGYMILAIGADSWGGACFYLITNGFTMTLLTLAGASVLRACSGEGDLLQLGGLIRKIPVTAVTFGVGILTLAGVPFLSAYYSRGMILGDTGAFASRAIAAGASPMYWVFFVAPMIATGIVAYALARAWILTFIGRSRNRPVYNEARELSVVWTPLIFLAILAIGSGGQLMNVRGMLSWSQRETDLYGATLLGQSREKFSAFSTAWPIPESEADQAAAAAANPPLSQTTVWVHKYLPISCGVGFLLAILIYWRGPGVAAWFESISVLRWIAALFRNELYVENFYRGFLAQPIEFFASLTRATEWLFDSVVRLLLRPGK